MFPRYFTSSFRDRPWSVNTTKQSYTNRQTRFSSSVVDIEAYKPKVNDHYVGLPWNRI